MGLSCGGGFAGVESELVAKAGDTVTSLAFAPDGRLFLTEQNSGRVRIITADGELLEDCDVALASDSSGIIHYSNGTEVRRLLPQ